MTKTSLYVKQFFVNERRARSSVHPGGIAVQDVSAFGGADKADDQGFVSGRAGTPSPEACTRDEVPSKYSCTSWMATAPSPTAEATLFVDRCRTSPTANTPGRLVSSASGGRSVPSP